MKHYDAVVIGAGPGGYEAAIELGKQGMKTLLVDRSKEHIGGICLNEGCIPTKQYLECAEYVSKAPYFRECGVSVSLESLNLKQLCERTTSLKNEIRSGVVWLLDQSGVELMYGTAEFVDPHTLDISGEAIAFDKCIIATGSSVREIPNIPIDGKRILSSTDVFTLESLPRSIAIIGGGAIGCEFATFFNAFGVDVTMIVRGEQLLSGEDEEIAKALLRSFKKRGINVLFGASVSNANVGNSGVKLRVTGDLEIESEIVLSATGRIPNTAILKPERGGVERDEKGFIDVDASFQTTQKHIYAVGDCIDTPAYAHTAYTEARIAAHNLLSGEAAINSHVTPSAVFSASLIASCGLKESEAKELNRAVEVKKAYFKANAKAKIKGDDSGFIKLIVCAKSGVVLGASLIGADATEIIHEMVLAVEQKMTLHDLEGIIHIHPSISEIARLL